MNHPRLILAAVLLSLSPIATAGEGVAPEAMIKMYCEEMFNGAFTSTEGVQRILKLSIPEAEKLFCCGYDTSLVIKSCEISEKRISPSQATFRLRFKVLGRLSGYQFQADSKESFMEDVALVKSNARTWKFAKFTDIPRQSVNSAIHGLTKAREYECSYSMYEAFDEPCPIDEELKKLRIVKGQ